MDNFLQEFFALYGATEILYKATKDILEKLQQQTDISSRDIKILETQAKSLHCVRNSLTDSYCRIEPNYLTYPKKIKERIDKYKTLTKKVNEIITESRYFIETTKNVGNNVNV